VYLVDGFVLTHTITLDAFPQYLAPYPQKALLVVFLNIPGVLWWLTSLVDVYMPLWWVLSVLPPL